MSARATQLSTFDFAKLNHACLPIDEAFKIHRKSGRFGGTYLVGSALERPDYRDVDVRTILDDEDFDELFGGKMFFWSIFNLGITAYLRDVTGLPIDYQVQRMTEANETYGTGKGTSRNPVGTKARPFAGGGDATGLIRTHDFESETKADGPVSAERENEWNFEAR